VDDEVPFKARREEGKRGRLGAELTDYFIACKPTTALHE